MSAEKSRRIEGAIARSRPILESARAKAIAELGPTEDGELEDWPDEPTGVLRIRAELGRLRLEKAAKE